MNKNRVMVLTVLFMVFAGLQFAEPVAAVKVVDHGTKIVNDHELGWMKIVWKTYQYRYKKTGKINNNFVKTYAKYYFKQKSGKYKLVETQDITLAKVTKSTIKITINARHPGEKPIGKPGVTYRKTKLTAAQYYWRVFRSEL